MPNSRHSSASNTTGRDTHTVASEKMAGNLIVIAAPSGAGKTSLVSAVLDTVDAVELSVSHTTRPMRDGETDGENYHFVDTTAFQELVKQDAFVEHAEVFGNNYGTSKQALASPLENGEDVILEIDWQGALAIKQAFPDAIRVFILPPSIESLAHRLNNRGKDSPEVIHKRMEEAQEQISHYKEFDYIIVNDDFDKALNDLQGLIYASRLRLSAQQKRYYDLLSNLMSQQ